MKPILKLTAVILLISLLNACCEQQEKVKNIILLIGDGMGTSQIYAAYTVNKGQLNLERAQYVGFSKTSSADHYITDSGAAGSAIATGKKTKNEAISVDGEGQANPTILEFAEKAGLSTGLVATSSITHATPASFAAHDTSRRNYEAIAADFAGSGIDLFIGGGKNHFEKRADGANYSDSLRKEGYNVVYKLDDIEADSSQNTACLMAAIHPGSVLEGRGDYLSKATALALQKLSHNPKGFFIMVEGSQIDWGGHDKSTDYVVTEILDFDRIIGLAFDYADAHPGTLVIVTADHETGGLALMGGDIEKGTVQATFATDYHTAVMVPVFSYGTGAESFSGIYENTALFTKMMDYLGLRE